MLTVVNGNSATVLVDDLLARLDGLDDGTSAVLTSGPMEGLPVGVPGRMKGWLTRRLATHLGVLVGDLASPGTCLTNWSTPLVEMGEAGTYGLMDTTLGLMNVFSATALGRGLPGLGKLVEDSTRQGATVLHIRALAQMVQRLMDQRPDWVERWMAGASVPELTDSGNDEVVGWQSSMVRFLGNLMGTTFPMKGVMACIEALFEMPVATGDRRVGFLFGGAEFTRIQWEWVAALSRHMDLVVYRATSTMGFAGEREALESPLLKTLGGRSSQGQAFLLSLEEQVPLRTLDRFVAPTATGLLGAIQRSVLENRPFDYAGKPDNSVQLHRCASPQGEVETLLVELAGLFEQGVNPQDVLVLAPSITEYAPLIEMVFGGHPGFRPRIYDIRVPDDEGPGALLLRCMELINSRLSPQEVFGVLDHQRVRAHFSLDEPQVDSLFKAVVEAQIRGFIDQEHRARYGVASFDQHTWRWGMDRLLLGCATGAQSALFGGVAPSPALVHLMEPLGRFIDFCEALFAFVEQGQSPASVAVWCERISQLIRGLCGDESAAPWVWTQVQLVLDRLETAGRNAHYDGVLDSRAVALLLEGVVVSTRRCSADSRGRVRFADIHPLRGRRFKVVAFLGMAQGAFPVVSVVPPFDLISRFARPLDPDPRQEGQQQFLDAICQATKCVLFFASGLTSGWADPVAKVVRTVSGGLVEKIHHPAEETLVGGFVGETGVMVRQVASPCLSPASGVEAAAKEIVPLSHLIRFWKNPAAFLAHTLCQVAIPDLEEKAADRERLQIAGLDEWRVGQQVVSALLDGTVDQISDWLIAAGFLPPGTTGQLALAQVLVRARAIASELGRRGWSAQKEWVDVAVPVKAAGREVRIEGQLRLQPGGVNSSWGYGQNRPHHRLTLWIEHLVAKAALGAAAGKTFRVGRQKERAMTVEFDAVDDPARLLGVLVSGFLIGRERPIAFWPDWSYEYIRRIRKNGAHVGPQLLANYEAQASRAVASGADEGWRMFWPQVPFYDGTVGFDRLARQVFEPIFNWTKQ